MSNQKKSASFVKKVMAMAKEAGLNCFVITDEMFGVTNHGNPAVANARNAHKRWMKRNGYSD